MLKAKDEIIIQCKIDGTLTEAETARFNKLIETSPEARALYRQLLDLHHVLQADSKEIPLRDISGDVMQLLSEKTTAKRQLPKHSGAFSIQFRKNFLAYAAILLLGLVIGSLATYLRTSTETWSDITAVTGTMVQSHETAYLYNKNGTKIKMQQFNSDSFHLLTYAINTKDTVYCTISGIGNELAEQNVELLFAEGSFQLTSANDGVLKYLCVGKNIFQIKGMENTSFNIRFTNKNKVICELNVD